MPSLKELRRRLSKPKTERLGPCPGCGMLVKESDPLSGLHANHCRYVTNIPDRRKRVSTEDQFARHAGLTKNGINGSVVWIIEPPDGKDAKIFFGKHRQKKISEIIKIDPSYLTWLLKQVDEDDEDPSSLAGCDSIFTEELANVIRYQLALRKYAGYDR